MMPRLGNTSLANLPEPRSVEEIAAFVITLDKRAENRYSALSRELRVLGSKAVADLFEELGGEHRDHAGRVAQRAIAGKRPGVYPKEAESAFPQVLSEDAAADCDLLGLTPYKAFALAVTLAQQSFQVYSFLAAAKDEEIHDYAQRLAGEQLSRAARLRVGRRRAYRAERGQPKAAGYPAAALVESLADLLAAAHAIEDRLAERLAEAEEQDSRLAPACRATRQNAERLGKASEQAGKPSGPLAEVLKTFTESAQTKTQAGRDRSAAERHLLAECERAFSFYDALASAPADESVMLQAQDLSQAAVERIRQVRASSTASDEAGRRDGNR